MIYYLMGVFLLMASATSLEAYNYVNTRKPVHAAFFVLNLLLAIHALVNYTLYVNIHPM